MRPFGPWYSLAPSCYGLSPPTSTAATLHARHVTYDHDEQDRDVLRAQLVLEGVDSDGLAVASGAACFDFLRVFASNGTHHTLAQVAASPRGYHVNIQPYGCRVKGLACST